MRFYHYWNVKSRSPCFSEAAEFPCPVAFLTACWERECLVIHAGRAEALGGWNSVGAAVLSVCRLNPIIPAGTSETHCLSAAWHWCIVSSENHCPLTPKLCWMCKNGDASAARTCQTDTSYPMFSYKQRNKKMGDTVSQVHLNRYKEPKFVISAPLMSPKTPSSSIGWTNR